MKLGMSELMPSYADSTQNSSKAMIRNEKKPSKQQTVNVRHAGVRIILKMTFYGLEFSHD